MPTVKVISIGCTTVDEVCPATGRSKTANKITAFTRAIRKFNIGYTCGVVTSKNLTGNVTRSQPLTEAHTPLEIGRSVWWVVLPYTCKTFAMKNE